MKRISTFDLLLKQHGKVLIPLSELCEEYLGVTYRVARRHYLSGSLLIPVVAMGKGQKAKLVVHMADLAAFVDSQRR